VTWQNDEIVFLQYTRSKKHDISMDQLKFYNDLLVARKANKSQQKFKLYFVVPAERYDEFELQHVTVPNRMKNPKSKGYYVPDIDKKVGIVLENIEQWVAEIKD